MTDEKPDAQDATAAESEAAPAASPKDEPKPKPGFKHPHGHLYKDTPLMRRLREH